LKDELVDLYLLVFTDTATRLNIEFTNEHRFAVEKYLEYVRSGINEIGFEQMKEHLGEMKEEFTEITTETEFQEMLEADDDDYQSIVKKKK